MECSECKEIYIGSTQVLNTRISLHKSNSKIEENRKLNVSKHLYQGSRRRFKIMPIFYTNDYTLLQINKNNFIDNLNQSWLKHESYTHTQMEINITHTHTHTHTHIYIYI